MKEKYYPVVFIILIVACIGVLFLLIRFGRQSATTPIVKETSASQVVKEIPQSSQEAESSSSAKKQVREFTVEGTKYAFTPNQIKVKVGDMVKINFVNKDGTHDFVIDKLSVKSKTLNTGESQMLEFSVTEKGTFEFYCSVGNHKAMGMKGTLVVE